MYSVDLYALAMNLDQLMFGDPATVTYDDGNASKPSHKLPLYRF